MAPVLCFITPGELRPSSDAAALVARVGAAARAGAQLIQIREHGIDAGQLARVVRAALAAVAGTQARVIVNDRLDVALAVRAHGVHLRETSVAPADARALAPRGFLIGRSVHTSADASRLAAAGHLDYLMFGAVYPTPSKPGAAGAGVEALRLAVQGSPVPVLAVGGMDGSTAAAVGAAGAAGLAAIRWWSAMPLADLRNATQKLAAAFAAGAGSRR